MTGKFNISQGRFDQTVKFSPAKLARAIALAGLSFPASTALAASCTVTANRTSMCLLDHNESATVTSDGTISVNGGEAVVINTSAVGVVIDNAGTISSSGASAIMSGGSTQLSLANQVTGSISSTVDGGSGESSAVHLYGPLLNGSIIDNAGSLSASASVTSGTATAYGIYSSGSPETEVSISNRGTITVDAQGQNAAAEGVKFSNGFGSASFTNSGVIGASAAAIDNADTYGVRITGATEAIGTGGAVRNTGTIFVSAAGANTTNAEGVSIRGMVQSGGLFENSGLIDVDILNGGSLSNNGYGAYIGDIAGSVLFTDSSVIDVDVDGSGARAYGISIGSLVVGGSFENHGTVSTSAAAPNNAVWAYGLYGSYMYSGSSFLNTGAIDVDAHSVEGGAVAYGIGLSSQYGASTAVNEGSLSVHAESDVGQANAYGLNASYLYSDSTLINRGSITATAIASSASARAYGFEFSTLEGSSQVENHGTISAVADATAGSATAYGVYGSDLLSESSFLNTGNVSAQATATGGTAEASGLSLGPLGDGLATGAAYADNQGNLDATAQSDGAATAYGIRFTSHIVSGSEVSNSGNISTSAVTTSTTAEANAYGIYVENRIDSGASFTSSGEISVSATAADSTANAYGIHLAENILGESAVSIDEASSLIVTASGAEANAYGIAVFAADVEKMRGSLNNAADIQVSATSTSGDAEAYGLFMSASMEEASALTNSGAITIDVVSAGRIDAAGWHLDGPGSDRNSDPGWASDLLNSGDITIDATSTGNGYVDVEGIYINDRLATGVEFRNTGNIDLTVDTGENSGQVRGLAIDMRGSDAAQINEGNISIAVDSVGTGTGSSSIHGEGVYSYVLGYYSSDSAALLQNTGNISVDVSVDQLSSYAYARGLFVEYLYSGVVDNSGEISVRAEGKGTGRAESFGIYVSSWYTTESTNSAVTNSGMVSATAVHDDRAEAGGIVAYEYVNHITNEEAGSLNAVAETVNGEALAVGIWVSNTELEANAQVANLGAISTEASSVSGTAIAGGLYVDYHLDTGAALINAGSIVTVSNGPIAEASGIYVKDERDSAVATDVLLENTGSILVQASGDQITAAGVATHAEMNEGSVLRNAGSIEVSTSASGTGISNVYGMAALDSLNSGALLEQTAEGSIQLDVTSTDGGINTHGVYIIPVEVDPIEAEVFNSDISLAGSIDVTAVSENGWIDANGIYSRAAMGAESTFTNAAEINISATSGAGVDANGIWFLPDSSIYSGSERDHSSDFLNTGNITIDAVSSAWEVDAAGIKLDRRFAAGTTFENRGDITISGEALGDLDVQGIAVDMWASDTTVVNNGNISVSVESTGTEWAGGKGSNINATGLYTYVVGYYSSDSASMLTNNGNISASAVSINPEYDVNASAMWIDYLYSGTVSNTAELMAYAEGVGEFSEAAAYGIYVSSWYLTSSPNALVTNSGAVSATAIHEYDATAIAMGGDEYVFNMTNEAEGSLSAYAEADIDTAHAAGMRVDSTNLETGGLVVNHGSISAEAVSTSGAALAAGIQVDDELSSGASLVNNGSIDARASGFQASAYGMYVADERDAAVEAGTSIENNGSIVVSATSDTATASGIHSNAEMSDTSIVRNTDSIDVAVFGENAIARGISFGDVVAEGASVVNTGSISVSAVGESAQAIGFEITDRATADFFQNTGEISATADGASATAYGLKINELTSQASFTNEGTLSASGENGADAYALYVADSNLDILNTGSISGLTYLAGDGNISNQGDFGSLSHQGNGDFTNAGSVTGDLMFNGDSNLTSTGSIVGNVTILGVGNVDNQSLITGDVSIANGSATNGVEALLDGDLSLAGTGDLANAGEITGNVSHAGMGSADNSGTIGGHLDLTEGSVTNSGSINGDVTISDTGSVFNSGRIEGAASVSNGGFSNLGTDAFVGADVMLGGTGDFVNEGAAAGSLTHSGVGSAVNRGSIAGAASLNNGDFENTTDGTVGSFVTLSGNLVNAGSIAGDVTHTGMGDADNNGTIDGSVNWAQGVVTNSGTILGDVAHSGPGSTDNSGSIDGAVSTVDGGFINRESGVVMGGVSLAGSGDLNNSGQISGGVTQVGSGSVNNSGEIYGSLATEGSYTLEAGGTHFLVMEDLNALSTIQVGETADLSAGTVEISGSFTSEQMAGLTDDHRIEFVSAGSITSGEFNFDSGDWLLWEASTYVEDTSAGIIVERVAFQDLVRQGGSITAVDAAAALNGVYTNSNSEDILEVVAGLADLNSVEQIADAFEQQMPALSGQSADAAEVAARTVAGAIQSRMNERAGLSSGDGLFSDLNIWSKFVGNSAEQSSIDGFAGYESDGSGILLGADGQISKYLSLGVAFAQYTTDASGLAYSQNSMVEQDSFQTSVYANWDFLPEYYGQGVVSYADTENRSERHMAFGSLQRTALGDYDGSTLFVKGAIGRELAPINGVRIAPELSVAYTQVDEDAYQEIGAGELSLIVDSNSIDNTRFSADARFGYDLSAGDTLVQFSGTVGMAYDSNIEATQLQARYLNSDQSFMVRGAKGEAMSGHITLGADAHLGSNWTLGLEAGYESSGEFSNQTYSAQLNYRF